MNIHPIAFYSYAPSLGSSAPISPILHLPPTKPDLDRHAQKSSDANPARFAHRDSAEGKLPVRLVDAVCDRGKRVHVDGAAQQALPENDAEDEIDRGQEREERVQDEDGEVEDLE